MLRPTGLTAGRPYFLEGTTLFGTSQGSACPDKATTYSASLLGVSPTPPAGAAARSGINKPEIELAKAVAVAAANVDLVAEINSASNQLGRTWSIPVSPEMQSTTPIWSGQMEWQRQVREILNAPDGFQVCREQHVDPERVYAVAVSMARSADRRTGRRVTASRAFLADRAGVSVTVLKRSRRVLSILGMAHEMARGRLLRTVERWAAEAHHGRRQTKAASVWALSSPKSVVTRVAARAIHRIGANRQVHPQTVKHGPQSLSTSFCSCTSVKKYKTTRACTHARRAGSTSDQEPRPITLQRAAGELLRHAPALKNPGHIGAVCDALRACSIDTERWSGRDIARALSDDTKLRGWIWPEVGTLSNPIRFLRWRLARMDWSGPSFSEQAMAVKLRRDEERQLAAREAARGVTYAASSATRTSAMARIRGILSSTDKSAEAAVDSGAGIPAPRTRRGEGCS